MMKKILCVFVLAICDASAMYYKSSSRMTGGFLAKENEFPYAVSLQQINQLNLFTRGHSCGGVLITLQHVLTTASCTYVGGTGPNPVPIVHTDYRVFAGSVVLTNDTSPEQFRVITNVTRHPNYTGAPAFFNDIAILTLNNPFNSSVVTPLSIPDESYTPAEGAQCVVVGWGSQNLTSTASVDQRYAMKYVASQNICSLQYALVPDGPNILPTMLCAASFDILSTGCNGDYGNGLVCNGGLAGILSIANICSPNSYPEVYTRVSCYVPWIRSITGAASTFQPGLALLYIFAVVQLIMAKIIS